MSGASQRSHSAICTAHRAARAPGASLVPVWGTALVAVAVLAACDRRPPPARVDSVPPPAPVAAPVDSAPPASTTTTWNADAGAALLVPGEQGGAVVVVPGTSDGSPTDTSSGAAEAVLPAQVMLFTRSGAAGQARADVTSRAGASPPEDCSVWPTARLGPASGADAVPRWTVGFARGRAESLPLDSLEGLAGGDSASLAAAITRAAAGLPGDTARRLRGLPFSVRSAWRFTPAPRVEAVVAVLVRTVNQEATPLGEHVLLVAERRGGAAAPFVAAYHERVVGLEETLELAEALAAVRLGEAGTPTLVLSRNYYEGSAYTLLERAGNARWRVRWTSVYHGC